jgi:hypothetical protein
MFLLASMKGLPECPHRMRRDEVQVTGDGQDGGAAEHQNGLETWCHDGKRSEWRLNGP